MEKSKMISYGKGFIPFALGAFLIGLIGGFTTALGPAFVQDLNLPYNNTTWTALAMAISTAACAPVLGKLGDVIGRKATLLLGIGIFTLGNVLTAIANSLLFMLIARFIVGAGSAAVAPVVLSYIVTEFPQEKIAKGFSLYMLISSAAVIFGPTIGGFLIAYYGWRAMVWVCVALCAVIFFICIFLRQKTGFERKPLTNFDNLGAVFILIAFGLFLCIPSFGQNFGWQSMPFFVVLIATVIAFAILIFVERKAAHPILQWKFIKRKTFLLSVLALFLTQGLMQANMTNMIVFVNYTQPGNTILSGYAISIMYIGMSLGSILLGPLADRYEPKKILTTSFFLTGVGCGLMLLFSQSTSILLLAASLGILGFGLGANATIFMKVVLSNVPEEIAGAGTGTYGLFRDLAAPFGVAVFVPLFTNSVATLIAEGAQEAGAAVQSIQSLALAEVACVAVGILVVLLLPKIYKQKKGELV